MKNMTGRNLAGRWRLCFLLLFVSHLTAAAQSGKLPPFRMMQLNGKMFSAEQLPVGKPILLIYFSPECDHCDKLINAFFKQAADFKSASVAMISFLPVEKMSPFAKKWNVNKHPNIFLGTEGTSFFVRNYFKIMDLPFVALYTKEGNLIKTFRKDISMKEVSKVLSTVK